MTLAAGTVLENRYRIDVLLGQGGMGAVYRAYDTRLEQSVAIKENAMATPEALKQFKREALVLARLHHPNLPRVSDHFVTAEGSQYLVMDFIAGEDLGQLAARTGALSEAQAVTWISQICSALEYLHSQQPPIIHRDIKPQNIKVTPQGHVFLVDFGIAKVGEASKTTTGALGVTPGFSPPEQYGMGGTDARSDIYALGATLYALLTGRVPPESIMLMGGEAQLTPPRQVNAGISPSMQQAVLKAMASRRTDRPQTVTEFKKMLTGGPYRDGATRGVERGTPPSARLPDQAKPRAAGAMPTARPPVRATQQPQAVSIPGTRPRTITPPPVRKSGTPLLPLLIGVGIVAVVLVGLVIVAILGAMNNAKPGLSGTSWDARGVAVAGNYAYVANGDHGLRIVNIADPAHPTLGGSLDISGTVRGVAIVNVPAGTYAYVAGGASGLHIIDASHLMAVAIYKTQDAQHVTVNGNYAYVADGYGGLRIIDVSNRANPAEVGHYSMAGYAWDVALAGDYAYVAGAYQGLHIIKISSPTGPTLASLYDTPGRAMGVAVDGSYAYVADADGGLQIVSVANPMAPYSISSFDTPGEARAVALAGGPKGTYAYIADGTGGMRVVNISDPAHPAEAGSLDTPGEAWDVEVIGDYAYIADGTNGLSIINIASLR
jgi:hypothetical protein